MLKNKNFEKEYHNLTDNFHKKLLNVSLVITFISFVIEIIYYPLCLKANMIIFPFLEYALMFVIKPTLVNNSPLTHDKSCLEAGASI